MQNAAMGDFPWGQPTTADPPYTTDTVTVPYVQPVDTGGNIAGAQMWPPIPEPMADPIPGTEEFHDFMCWLAGFTDPDTPPSQERWEAFQQKVREMAVLFWEYKKEQRSREFNHTGGLSVTMTADATAGAGLVANQAYGYNMLTSL